MDAISFIKPDDYWSLWAIILGWAAISIYLDKKYKWASMMSSCIIALLGAMIMANIGFIPLDSPVYDIIWDYVIPIAVPLLLFKANIKKIIKESGKLFIVFHFAALGTVIGTIIANLIFRNGGIPELQAVSAMISASYIGGSVNLAAMKTAYNASSEITSAAVVADNLLMAIYFFVLAFIPTVNFFLSKFKHPVIDKTKLRSNNGKNTASEKSLVSVQDIALAMAISVSIVAVSKLISGFIGSSALPTVIVTFFSQQYLWITALTLISASLFPSFFESISGSNEIGEFFINIFFVAIGVPASIAMILNNAPLLFVYAFIIVAVNMLTTLGLGKLFNFNLEDLIIGSNATIGGPTTAAALASSKGWTELVAPAVLVGVWGYVIGNWIAPIIANLMF